MAYVRGAKRHPMVKLTITPEQEAAIEAELNHPRERYPVWGLPACGTIQAYWRHKKVGEPHDEACLEAGRAYSRARWGAKKARQDARKARNAA